jgi:putative DNA primase/helicase
VVAAVAAEVLAEKVKDPKQRDAIMKAINERLEQREKAGKVPSVPVYDKAAPTTQQQPERTRPQVERNAERTR